MVFGEQQSLSHVLARAERANRLRNQVLQEEFFAKPHRHCHAERLEAARRERQIRLEEPLELEQRFVVERDVIDVVERISRGAQAISDGVLRKSRIVLLARESLFLRGGDNGAVIDKRGSAVVIERGYAQYFHGVLNVVSACGRS